MSSQGSFNNYLNQMLPITYPLNFIYITPSLTWPSVDILMTPCPSLLVHAVIECPQISSDTLSKGASKYAAAPCCCCQNLIIRVSICLSIFLSWDKHYWTQLDWARYSAKSGQFTAKNAFLVYLAVNWPNVGQLTTNIGWATSMSFASIYSFHPMKIRHKTMG